jgi:phospholipase C
MTDTNKLDCFEHVVVLMLENRSFDNMLGYLSTAVDGVIGKDLSNPAPTRDDGKPVDGADQGPVFVSPGTVMDNPNPDPGEYFPHINTQLYNCVSPPQNAFQSSYAEFQSPYNQPNTPPEPQPEPAPMTGFVQDYYNNYVATQKHKEPTRAQYSIIMNSFPTDSVPVISGLANNFAVCDQWHCAVPSQTFCNRSFFNAGTSNGQVVNEPFDKWLKNDNETIFNRLEAIGKDWAIYFDEEDVFPLTLLIHFPKLWEYVGSHFHHMDKFYSDVENGTLPAYSFVEPRLFLNHNDQHPPVEILGKTQHSSVTAGEYLINDVYNAIRTSNTQGSGASNSSNTLLTITYDEHGGCYDHVSPPPATPPKPGSGEMGFSFDRLGVRVSTVMVSAWIKPGNVVSAPLQHCSMLKTLSMKWGFAPLTARDESANDFLEVFNNTSARPGSSWPTLTPIAQAKPDKAAGLTYLLNDLQKAIVATVNELGEDHSKDELLLDEMTVEHALDFMSKKWKELLNL